MFKAVVVTLIVTFVLVLFPMKVVNSSECTEENTMGCLAKFGVQISEPEVEPEDGKTVRTCTYSESIHLGNGIDWALSCNYIATTTTETLTVNTLMSENTITATPIPPFVDSNQVVSITYDYPTVTTVMTNIATTTTVSATSTKTVVVTHMYTYTETRYSLTITNLMFEIGNDYNFGLPENKEKDQKKCNSVFGINNDGTMKIRSCNLSDYSKISCLVGPDGPEEGVKLNDIL